MSRLPFVSKTKIALTVKTVVTMKKSFVKGYKLYLFALLLLFVDTIFMGLLEQQVLMLLLCFYATSVLKTRGSGSLVYMLFLLACQSLIVDGHFGFSLLYLLPLSIIVLEAKNLLNTTVWLPYAFLSVSIATHELFIRHYLLHLNVAPLFVLIKICVNLAVVALFEKYVSQR